MKYSYNWLKELSGTKKSSEALAEFLTMRAFEVESVERVGFDTDGVVVGEVKELEKHPNADRLRVAKIDVGSETLQIVCGAPNIAVGQKVPVALIGTKLPGNFEIKQSEIRGMTSFGMVCSQKELGLGEDHVGIMVLPESASAGESFKDFLNDTDCLLDIKVLPDRAHDALSHVGMAREIAALEDEELDYDYDSLMLVSSGSEAFTVSVADVASTPRYIGALLRNVEVKSSPAWLKNRLKKLGIRPINNIVDVTNFVMMELGQPLHAFDWGVLAEGSDGRKNVFVRHAQEGEKIQLLDEKEYVLGGDDIVIADSEKALALAGVMGGIGSGVTVETKDIFLEGASFDPITIRKTRARLGLHTDASDRFEKGLDPNTAEKAIVRALELLAHVAKGEGSQVVDVYSQPRVSKKLSFHIDLVRQLLGIEVGVADISSRLPRLGFDVKSDDAGGLEITVPTYRLDIDSVADIIEEIGKMVGYDAIPVVAPSVPLRGVASDMARSIERRLKDIAVGNGFTETLSYAFYSRHDAEAVGMSDVEHLELANPMNPDQALMRASLLPNMLKNIRENLKHRKSLQLFESGNVYFVSDFQPVHESVMFAGAIVIEKTDNEPFYELKGLLDRMLRDLGIVPTYDTTDNAGSYWHPTRTADVFGLKGKELLHIGRIGEVHPFVLEHFHIKKRVAYFELDYDLLRKILPENKVFIPIRRYPEVLRDVSLFVPQTVRVKDVLEGIDKQGKGMVLDAELFDQYFDEAKKMKSLAFHIRFGVADRTLESGEVDVLLEKIVASLEKNLKAERRV